MLNKKKGYNFENRYEVHEVWLSQNNKDSQEILLKTF